MPFVRPFLARRVLLLFALPATACFGSPPDVGSSSSPPDTTSTSEGSGTDSSTGSTSTASTDTTLDTTAASDTLSEIGCGNGVIEDGEACDGEAIPQGFDCATQGYGEGLPVCLDCTMLDYSVCPDFTECGNGEVGVGEECDGRNLASASCDDFSNLTGRGLACTDECLYDTSACAECRESGESCSAGDTCCDAGEVCAGLTPHCCVVNGLGLCTN